jgi:hypothetical protein
VGSVPRLRACPLSDAWCICAEAVAFVGWQRPLQRLSTLPPGHHQPSDMPDFFISRAGPDAPWAEWAAWVLEEAGYTTLLQDWDFRPGGSFVREMQKGAVACAHTIALLSQDYFASNFTTSEWEAAFVTDPGGLAYRLITVRVRECEPEGLLSRYPYIDLVGKSEAEAAALLLAGVRTGRAKPESKPRYPGAASLHPAYPGGVAAAGGGRADTPRPGRSMLEPSADDADAARRRARELLGKPRNGAQVLQLVLGIAPNRQRIRPSVLGSEEFAHKVTLAGLAFTPPVLRTETTTPSSREGMLIVEQRDTAIGIGVDGAVLVRTTVLEQPRRWLAGTLQGIVEEDLVERIERILAFLFELQRSLDQESQFTVVAAAGIYGSMVLGWQTRTEMLHAAGHGMSINPSKDAGEAFHPALYRDDAEGKTMEIAEDLTAVLRTHLRP